MPLRGAFQGHPPRPSRRFAPRRPFRDPPPSITFFRDPGGGFLGSVLAAAGGVVRGVGSQVASLAHGSQVGGVCAQGPAGAKVGKREEGSPPKPARGPPVGLCAPFAVVHAALPGAFASERGPCQDVQADLRPPWRIFGPIDGHAVRLPPGQARRRWVSCYSRIPRSSGRQP